MLAVDLKAAFSGDGDWFTAQLLRLIAKADGENCDKLARGFPREVEAVRIYKNDCPYKDAAKKEVDWDEIARRSVVNEGR